MINRFLYIVIFMAGFAGGIQPALAQQCNPPAEMIVNLRVPSFGSYSVWDTIAGEKTHDERFKSAMLLDNDHIFAAGESALAAGDVQLYLAEVKENGRPNWEKTHAVAGLQSVVQVLPHERGAVILGTRLDDQGRSVLWFGVFDLNGVLLSQTDIAQRKTDLEGYSMVRMGERYMIAASMRRKGLDALSSAVLFDVAQDGRVVSDKAIVTGYENRIFGLSVLPGGDVLATGYIYLADGRKAGWIVRLTGGGDIVWQRSYPRGAGAQFRTGLGYVNNMMLVLGTALPTAREGNRAAWLMVVDGNNGEIGWQRYYVSNALGYLGRDLLVSDDNLISVLIDGEVPMSGAVENEETGTAFKEHVKVLTLNPRGVIFAADGFFNGQGVDAHDLLFGANAERVIVGASNMRYVVEQPEGAQEEEPVFLNTIDAWLAAATTTDPYDDPCVQPPRFLP